MAEEKPTIPDVYVDQVQINLNPYGALFMFSLSQPATQPGGFPSTEQVRLRMSLEHAKVLAMIAKRVLRNMEDQQGYQIKISPAVLNSMGLSEEDW